MIENLRHSVDQFVRRRRADRRADVLDSLSTLMSCGLPLADAIGNMAGALPDRSSVARLLHALQARLHDGQSLSEAASTLPRWFDVVDRAVLRAGERSGSLAATLATLAARRHEDADTRQRLAMALAYPSVVAVITVVVIIVMGRTSLPDLCSILERGHVPVPTLTRFIVSLSTVLTATAAHLPAHLIAGVAVVAATRLTCPGILTRHLAWRPAIVRRATVGSVLVELAGILRSGVPLVDALRAQASTSVGPLEHTIEDVASRLEAGCTLGVAFGDRHWFSDEFRRLLVVAEASGSLPYTLEQIGRRDVRRARRQLDRVIATIEPVAIAILAIVIGLVAMAAVLPLLRLQETLH